MPKVTLPTEYYAQIFQISQTPAELIADVLKAFKVYSWAIVPWDTDKGGNAYTHLVQIIFANGHEMDFLLIRGEDGLPTADRIQHVIREALA